MSAARTSPSMGGSPVSDTLVIQSHKGPYRVLFDEDAPARLGAAPPANTHFIVDRRVADLHAATLDGVLSLPPSSSLLRLEATEAAKSLERFPGYVAHLLAHGVRRDHVLIAIGGGIVQDITCFLAATLLRGMAWRFYPTTLLAQADSCIGSKSSINCGDAKNILGTFTPPAEVHLSTRFLDTLDERDLRSGIGEMLKVHAIEGPDAFDRLAADYPRLTGDRALMSGYIRRSLDIKRRFIEADEFDRGIRNVFNFGHSFGHAIEAATDFAIPHGIAVTLGMDMAVEVARGLGLCGDDVVRRMRPVLRANAFGFEGHPVPFERFLAALAKDKKNVGSGSVTLILPDHDGRIGKSVHSMDEPLRTLCRNYLDPAQGR